MRKAKADKGKGQYFNVGATLNRDPTARGEKEREREGREREREKEEEKGTKEGEGGGKGKKEKDKEEIRFQKQFMSASTNCPRLAVFLCWGDSES